MTFKYIFGHYANMRLVERIPQFHAEYRYVVQVLCLPPITLNLWRKSFNERIRSSIFSLLCRLQQSDNIIFITLHLYFTLTTSLL